MISNTNKLFIFISLVLTFGFAVSFIPQRVGATASGYVCSDGDYDPREGGSSMPSGIYSETFKHSWGVCKDGSQPTAPVTASGYICSDGGYDPREGGSSMPSDIYYDLFKHAWGVCKNGTQPTAPATNTTNTPSSNTPTGCAGVDTNIIDCVGTDGDGLENNGLWNLLLNVINILSAGIGIAAVGGVAYGAILYSSAGGNAENIKKAKTMFINIGIGIAAYLLMYSLLNFLIPGGIFN